VRAGCSGAVAERGEKLSRYEEFKCAPLLKVRASFATSTVEVLACATCSADEFVDPGVVIVAVRCYQLVLASARR
jgi:hypothetical protein